jgi:hypothetical protein
LAGERLMLASLQLTLPLLNCELLPPKPLQFTLSRLRPKFNMNNQVLQPCI